MIAAWMRTKRSITVPCTVELEQTPAFLRADVHLDGIEVEAGDEVQVHDAPTSVPFGETQVFRRTATVTRASALDKLVTRLLAYRELTELYETGFDAEAFAFSTDFRATASRGR